jgi:hypothetical protein
MNVINYREDENLFTDLLKNLGEPGSAKLRLASGYLNLQKGYLNAIFGSFKQNTAL